MAYLKGFEGVPQEKEVEIPGLPKKESILNVKPELRREFFKRFWDKALNEKKPEDRKRMLRKLIGLARETKVSHGSLLPLRKNDSFKEGKNPYKLINPSTGINVYNPFNLTNGQFDELQSKKQQRFIEKKDWDEEHSQIDYLMDRFPVKAVGRTPEAQVSFLKKRHPHWKFDYIDGRIHMESPDGEKGFLDRGRFDFWKDTADILPDIAVGAIGTFLISSAAAKGAVAGAFLGPKGMLAGALTTASAASGAYNTAAELVTQVVGEKLLGMDGNINPDLAVLSGIAGAMLPFFTGAQASGKSLASAMTKKGLSLGPSKQFDSLVKAQRSPIKLGLQKMDDVTSQGLKKTWEKVDIPEAITGIKATDYSRWNTNLNEMRRMSAEGPENVTGDLIGQAERVLMTKKQRISDTFKDVLKDTDAVTDVSKAKEILNNSIKEAKDDYANSISKGTDPKHLKETTNFLSLLENLRKDLFTRKQSIPHVDPADQSLQPYFGGLTKERMVDVEIPNVITAQHTRHLREAVTRGEDKSVQQALKQMGVESLRASDYQKLPVEIQRFRGVVGSIKGELDTIQAEALGLKELNNEWAIVRQDLSKLRKEYMDSSTPFNASDIEKYGPNSYGKFKIRNESKSKKKTNQFLNKLEKNHPELKQANVNLVETAENVRTFVVLDEPAWRPVGNKGITSTTLTYANPISASFEAALSKIPGWPGEVLGPMGRVTGNLMSSPKIWKNARRAVDTAVKSKDSAAKVEGLMTRIKNASASPQTLLQVTKDIEIESQNEDILKKSVDNLYKDLK